MKKGYLILLLSLMIVVVGFSKFVSADFNCVDGTSTTECVCGHTPNSPLGYGQVIIGGAFPTVISCNNINDAVCPEDFMDPVSGLNANCSNCPDPDCSVKNLVNTGYVYGQVLDSNNRPIDNVLITGHPIKWNNSANLDRNTSTDTWGRYNTTVFIAGKYFFSASKNGYDTQLIEATVIRGQIIQLNFRLTNGTCHDDCTNSENRCKAECDGVTFNDTRTNCSFFTNATFPFPIIRDACDNKNKSTRVRLNQINENYTYFVDCCESTPTLERYRVASPDTSAYWIKDLIKTEKIARLDDYPVRVVVAYWTKG